MSKNAKSDPKNDPLIPVPDRSWTDATVPPVLSVRSVSMVGIFIILLIHFLSFAASILIPLTLALLLSTTLLPIQRSLTALKVPLPASAALIALALTIGVIASVYVFAGPLQDWMQRMPTSIQKIENNLRSLKQPIEDLKEATDKIQEATQLNEGQADETEEVKIQQPAISDNLIDRISQFLVSSGIVIVLVLFFLITGDGFLGKIVAVVPRFRDKKLAVEIVRSIQQDIAGYLFMLTVINAGLGVVMGVVLAIMGIDTPVFWGVLVFFLAFAPYAGSTITFALLAVVGMMTFDGLGQALVAPIIYVVLMFIYGNFLIPYAVGNRLSLNPVAIFVAIVFWGWLWGIAGALLAVPILASFKIIADRFDSLRPVSKFLSP